MGYALSEVRKALVAAVPFIIAAGKVVSDGLGDGTVSTQEWLTAGVAGLAAYGVFRLKNQKPAGKPADPDVSEAEGYGYTPAHLDRPEAA
jgi:hypothetical protein